MIDFVICLGGDGTILWASGLFQFSVPPVVSFSLGSLGFLTVFQLDDVYKVLESVIDGGFKVTLRSRLRCLVVRGEEDEEDGRGEQANAERGGGRGGEEEWRIVLNDVVVDRGANNTMISLDCYCDSEPVTTVSADGLLISTPTGIVGFSQQWHGVPRNKSAQICSPTCDVRTPMKLLLQMTQLCCCCCCSPQAPPPTRLQQADQWYILPSHACCLRQSVHTPSPSAPCCSRIVRLLPCTFRRMREVVPLLLSTAETVLSSGRVTSRM
jgi:hypothetical protein